MYKAPILKAKTTQGMSARELLQRIDDQMTEACHLGKRPREDVQLVAVSKTFAAEAIRPYLEAGQRIFGENRVQEAKEKWPDLRKDFADIELHLIGPLQTNKVREALALFDVIETIDRDKLAAEIAQELAKPELAKLAMTPRFYVQVNTGEEPQKAGIAPREALDFVARCRTQYGLNITGLMCIPPADDPPGPHFALLDKLADEAGLKDRSMGMSADFEAAIMCGSTHIRVGSALFGTR